MSKTTNFITYQESIPALLASLELEKHLPQTGNILIKPNLINDSPPPITTPVACCREIIIYLRSHTNAHIVIAEGCGQPEFDTSMVFHRLGYTKMADELSIDLVDLNTAELVHLHNQACPVFPEMHLPKIAVHSFLISVPVLKAHSLTGITGALKNMIGLAPPAYYSGRYGTWKKAAFHANVQQAILDLVSYKCPDFSVLDARVGMPEYHLGGAHCNPPLSKLVAGYNPWEVDREGARLLDLKWKMIGHLHE